MRQPTFEYVDFCPNNFELFTFREIKHNTIISRDLLIHFFLITYASSKIHKCLPRVYVQIKCLQSHIEQTTSKINDMNNLVCISSLQSHTVPILDLSANWFHGLKTKSLVVSRAHTIGAWYFSCSMFYGERLV